MVTCSGIVTASIDYTMTSQKWLTSHSENIYKMCAGVGDSAAQQTQGVQSMKAQCWPTVYNVGPTPCQPRLNISAWRDERLSFT